MLVSGCATNVLERQPLPKELLQVQDIKLESAPSSNATETQLGKLENVVRLEIGKRNHVGKLVNLRIVVTRAEFVSKGTRALAGALAGANHLDVDVFITSPEAEVNLGEFSVNGEYNPGGFGVFSDPLDSAALDVAKAIADKVFGTAK